MLTELKNQVAGYLDGLTEKQLQNHFEKIRQDVVENGVKEELKSKGIAGKFIVFGGWRDQICISFSDGYPGLFQSLVELYPPTEETSGSGSDYRVDYPFFWRTSNPATQPAVVKVRWQHKEWELSVEFKIVENWDLFDTVMTKSSRQLNESETNIWFPRHPRSKPNPSVPRYIWNTQKSQGFYGGDHYNLDPELSDVVTKIVLRS